MKAGEVRALGFFWCFCLEQPGRRSLLAQGTKVTALHRAGVTGTRRRAKEAAAEGRGLEKGVYSC